MSLSVELWRDKRNSDFLVAEREFLQHPLLHYRSKFGVVSRGWSHGFSRVCRTAKNPAKAVTPTPADVSTTPSSPLTDRSSASSAGVGV